MEEVREEMGPNRESRSDGVALGMDGSGGGDDLSEGKSEDEADVEAVTDRERKIVNRTERD